MSFAADILARLAATEFATQEGTLYPLLSKMRREGLLEYETLSGEEIKALLRGEKPARDLGDDTPPSRGSAVPKTGAKKDGSLGAKGEEPEGGFEPQPR